MVFLFAYGSRLVHFVFVFYKNQSLDGNLFVLDYLNIRELFTISSCGKNRLRLNLSYGIDTN